MPKIDARGVFGKADISSQALLDEKALVACMAYVDLNPVRAKMAKVPEDSEYTSIKKRIDTFQSSAKQPTKLAKFVGNPREPMLLCKYYLSSSTIYFKVV